ncbi:MAG: hypothetical protein J6A08_12475 [Lachnospiraceae bacterium]|nr:hypothetical protein [Lachnospiraceae bacterium]
MLKEILKEAGYNWARICPEDFNGALPTIDSVKLYLQGAQIPEELVATQFRISQKKAFSILEGSNVYEGQFVFLREFLQNAIDASKIQYWNECVRTRGYYQTKDAMKKMSPDSLEEILSTDIFPIEIEMQIVKRDEDKQTYPIEEDDVEQLRKSKKKVPVTKEEAEEERKRKRENWQYGVEVRIKDFGTGIDKESIQNIANVGNSRKKEQPIIREMPEWLKPTAEFGIGLQSAFLLTNMFKCHTYTRSNEKYEITFSTVKSNYYEGYINVQPIDKFNTKDDAYGTCFEVFVPFQKKLKHERYPLAWDGKDYFDEDYEALRPLRHSAELLAQMALYLDGLVGEQMFPIHLNVIHNDYVTIPLNSSDKNRIRNLKFQLTGGAEEKSDIEESRFEDWEQKDLDKVKCIFQKRDWQKNGKSWIYYYDKKEKHHKEDYKGIIIQKTEKSVALLDSKDGHLYYWDNELCTFCLINMENFLLLERQQTEKGDKNCENALHKVRLYYKGIELEERKLPGIGNELFQYIDIKGKLERECINLSRKGFTEKGEEYFLNQIYYPLLEAIRKMLGIINKKHYDEVVAGIKHSLSDKRKALTILVNKIDKLDKKENQKYISEDQEYKRREMLQYLEKKKKTLIMMYKELLISVSMLSFFAQNDCLDLVTQIGNGEQHKEENCWKEIVKRARYYYKIDKDEVEKNLLPEQTIQKLVTENSVLFSIEHRPMADLMIASEKKGYRDEKKVINFPDIFSDENQFIIVSSRENSSAPWKLFLMPVWKKTFGEEDSIIYHLKRYFTMGNSSKEKEEVSNVIVRMGQNALEIARYYGLDPIGEEGQMSTGEYRQQYLLKWLLTYIPTIALFMSADGNIRINVIYSKMFPFVFMNDAAKKLTLKRIMQETENYGIQRFSIPAWQGLEYLSCESLPYSHYFVKRGYLSEESYSKVIFPFDRNELLDVSEKIVSAETMEKVEYYKELFEMLNVRKYLIQRLPEIGDKVDKLIETIQSEEKQSKVRAAYLSFYENFCNDERKAERVWDRVRVLYRSSVANAINYIRDDDAVMGSDIVVDIDKWEQVCLYLLVVSVAHQHEIELAKSEITLPKAALEHIGSYFSHPRQL